jgi:hypothetical protein
MPTYMTVVCSVSIMEPDWQTGGKRRVNLTSESAGLSDEDLSGLHRLAFIASWGGAFIRRVYGHRGNGLLTQIPANFRVESCLVFRHFQKELRRGFSKA